MYVLPPFQIEMSRSLVGSSDNITASAEEVV